MSYPENLNVEIGSGNVFRDLGLEDADELFSRAQIGYYVFKLIQDRHLKRKEIAQLLGIAQPDVSYLMNGQFSRFTTDKLLDFLRRLDQKVIIHIAQHQEGEPFQEVFFP